MLCWVSVGCCGVHLKIFKSVCVHIMLFSLNICENYAHCTRLCYYYFTVTWLKLNQTNMLKVKFIKLVIIVITHN